MAKGIRSKIKKRLRTVKRGVIKRELTKPGTSHNDREVTKAGKLAEALSGHIAPAKIRKNAFRSDDPDAEIPQHNWRQGPDFRSAFAGPDAGLAVFGARRPKQMGGGDAPTARVEQIGKPAGHDVGLNRILRTTEQMVPFMASRREKKRLKTKNKSGVDVAAAFRWT